MPDMGLNLSRGCETYAVIEQLLNISPFNLSRRKHPHMGLRLLFVAALLSVMAPVGASAEGLVHHASCSVVRYYVNKYGADMAESWARGKGASESEISAARRCVEGGSGRVRTAQETH